MKLKNIFAAAAALLALAFTSCDEEKEYIVIEGNLPIKASALYMVGDATPNGWSIDAPTPFAPTDEDPLVFTWEGNLNSGEMKLCLTPGSWDAPFIRPKENGSQIGKEEVKDAPFQMHAGDPDEKWRVAESGKYRLTFNLRNWTMSSVYLGAVERPKPQPVKLDKLYIVGEATPNGWNIDAPTELTKVSEYVFRYEGRLTPGDFKAVGGTGSWDADFVRPLSDGVKMGKDGVEDENIQYCKNPDHKWKVVDDGNYVLTFDLENFTVKVEFKGEVKDEKKPLESKTLYMVGDATPNGWSMDAPTAFKQDASDPYIFTWEGELNTGNMKACLAPDGTWSCAFLRPSTNGCEINSKGVAASDFVYTKGPDDQWKVTEAGKYKITFNLKNYTIEVTAVK